MKGRIKLGIRWQMVIVYALALLIPLAIGGNLLIRSAQQTLNDYYVQLLEADNRRVKTFLTEVTVQAYDICEEIVFSKELKNALRQEYSDSSEFLAAANSYSDLELLSYNSLEVASIYIYTNNPTIINYRQFRSVTEEVAASGWYQRALSYPNAFWVSITEESYGDTKSNLCLVRRITLPDSGYEAVAVVRVSDTYLRSRLSSGTIIDAISVDDGGIVYSSRNDLYGQPQPVDIDYSQTYFRSAGQVEVDGEPYFAAVSTINLYMTSSRMYICTLDRSGFDNIRSIMSNWIAILALALLVPLVILTIYSGRVADRITRLRREMHKASRNDHGISDAFGGNDELTEAFEDLKVMVRSIEEKDARMYEAQLKEKELVSRQQLMEYKMLSSQINPHYLYNTLETIRMKALTGGNRDVADAIKLLGKTLHYVLENTGTAFTTLRKELDHVENYLTIQRLRFGDRINYELEVAPDVDPEHYTVLPLLLQPVVENAVVHGLETVSGVGLVRVEISRRAEKLCIEIRDNGTGMSRQQLDAVREGLEAEQMPRSSIALYNIHQRIRLRYGSDYGVAVESDPGHGTCVSLTLPAE